MTENNSDNYLVVLSNIFDINYPYSYQIIIKEDYITKLISSLLFTDKNIENFFIQIKDVLNNYLQRKVSGTI